MRKKKKKKSSTVHFHLAVQPIKWVRLHTVWAMPSTWKRQLFSAFIGKDHHLQVHFFFFPSYMSHPSVACGAVGSKLNFLPCYYSLILLQCCHLVYLHSSCRSVASLGMFLAVYLSCCSFVWTHISLNVGDVDHFTKGICQRWSVWEIKRIISQTGSFGLCPRGGTLELLFIYAHFYFPSSL